MLTRRFGYGGNFQNLNIDSSLIHESSLTSLDKHKLNLLIYTDPLCCSCWALDPVIKRFLTEYGDYFNLILKMGGLLESWELSTDSEFSSREDMANHWREVGDLYGMPISGNVWSTTNLNSSYPASMAYIAAKNQGDIISLLFWRKLREAVFVYDKDIGDEYTLLNIASECGLYTDRFLQDYRSEKTKNIFFSEISEARSLGINFFPTVVFLGEDNRSSVVEGVRPYETYVFSLKEVLGYLPEKNRLKSSLIDIFDIYSLLSFKEITYLTDIPSGDIHGQLESLLSQGYIEQVDIGSSCYWKRKTDI